MKKNFKFLVYLLVFTMVLTLAPLTKAESKSLFSMEYEKQSSKNLVDLTLSAKENNVLLDGKLVLDYDSDLLKIKEISAGKNFNDDVLFTTNTKQADKIIITFVSSKAIEKGELIKISFEVLKKGNAKVSIDTDKSYVSDAEGYTLDSSLEFEVEPKKDEPSKPEEPSKPSDPYRPAEPDKPGKPNRPRKDTKPETKPETNQNLIKEHTDVNISDILNQKSNMFMDVNDYDYFKEAVDYVFQKGYMNGVGNNMFAPNRATNRAMIVSILWRMEGSPMVASNHKFDDVKANDYFAQAVYWAYENNITTGINDRNFGPNMTLTREQLVTFFYRYAQYKGYNTQASANLSQYKDYKSLSKYAETAMSWAIQNGIINGTSASTISPKNSATRGQLATIIMRFAKNYIK